jgi:Protein of unknown function (DUF4197)
MKKIFFFTLIAGFVACTPAQIQNAIDTASKMSTNNEPTSLEVGSGLKEALNLGIGKGVDVLSAKDGFLKGAYKILLPPEARKVADKLRNVPGFNDVEAIALEKINHGAEDAASKAKPIFVNAIKQMTIADAWSILRGDKNAATNYLKQKTYDSLYGQFNPTIVESLNKFNAIEYWGKAVNTYNKFPLVTEKANPRLDDYVTKEALNGLFSMVEKKELSIRTDKGERTSELLKKVFAKQDK